MQEHVEGSGRFSTTYTFGAGQASVFESFWMQVASLPMGNYPYAPANSRKLTVLVGGHPAPAPVVQDHKKRHRKGRRS